MSTASQPGPQRRLGVPHTPGDILSDVALIAGQSRPIADALAAQILVIYVSIFSHVAGVGRRHLCQNLRWQHWRHGTAFSQGATLGALRTLRVDEIQEPVLLRGWAAPPAPRRDEEHKDGGSESEPPGRHLDPAQNCVPL
jgi:hypothetical protein